MKKCLVTCLLFITLFKLEAQIGFTVSPTSTFAPQWQVIVENYLTHEHTEFLKYGATGMLDYTIPLNNPAWRIQPAIHGMRTVINYVPHQFDVFTIGLLGNVSFAPFLKNKTHPDPGKPVCYLQLSPGFGWVHGLYKKPVLEGGSFNGEYEMFEGQSFSWHLGFHLYLEWKLTELLCLAPMAGIRYFPNVRWQGFTEYFSGSPMGDSYDSTRWRHIMFGLRIGLNLKDT